MGGEQNIDDATLLNLLAYVKAGARICPQPQKGNELWLILPNRRRKGSGWEPFAPLILAAWWDTSDEQKAERLEHHIRWAHKSLRERHIRIVGG